ncbi:MAG: YihY/virulence factor BrkB family protein [Alphaproteobacteria bacterium]|nr:YihY/virulence factor BrkB family protein [Alphaproteobacteria bacterium]
MLRLIFKKIPTLFAKSISDFVNNDGIEHAGYMAFITILAIFPFMVLLISLAGMVGELEVSKEFIRSFVDNAPDHVQNFLLPRINEIISGPPESIMTIAILGAIWTASSSFEGLRTFFNRSYRVNTPPAYLLRRMLSILQFLAFTACVLLIMALLIIIPPFLFKFAEYFKIQPIIIPTIYFFRNFGLFIIIFIAISALYYFIPNKKQTLMQVIPGSLIVTISWSLSSKLLSLYIQNFTQVNLIYGGLEGIIITLLFFYINNITLIFGAEFNYHFINFMNKTNE